MGTVNNKSDDEYSVIGDKGDIGFIDFDNCKSVCNYNPSSESQIVQISVPFSFISDKPRSGFVGETIYDSVTVENITDEPLDLWSVSIYDSKPENAFTISLMEPPNANSDELYIQDFFEAFSLEDRVLRTGQALTIWLSCKPKEIGLYTAAVHFAVGDETMERLVFVLAEDKISQSLSSSKPYYRARKKKQNVVDVHTANSAYVVGRRPSKGSNRGFKNRLGDYPIPEHIREMIINQQVPDVVLEDLTKQNYALFFKNLLVMEEIKLEEDMRAYDMECVTMKGGRNNLLSLVVPGLAEKRPSLVNGDFIFVKLASEHETASAAYQGYIHRVEVEEIFLMFEEKFHKSHRESNMYNVQFSYNRTGMRRLYQAVEAAESLATNFLFPSLKETKPMKYTPLVPISCYELNDEQFNAVEMILACKPDSPYVIHGPPGTGKTMTLIEAILQSYNISRRTRILVCAPSNSAADHLLDRLTAQKSIKFQTSEIFRLNAFTCPFEDVNPDHVKFCHVEDFIFKCPSRWDLKKYRIIISTYTSASLLYAEGIKRGHFSYIFLDEAGQASEPETMVPLSQLHSRDTVVVLAGDPMQLGPVVFSKDAENYGLGTSYLDRLLKSEFYSSGSRDIMIKLVRNYRTHPQILHLPSELFYNGELIACSDNHSSFLASVDDILINKEFPLLFVGIQGCDEREGGNPSWFNRIEASKVVEIITVLTEEEGMKEEDIGVITPYRQQVLKIRSALEGTGRENVKVGSVEQFQGQEKQVVIISTVRSTVRHNEFDKLHYLGFLSNPKRFNVAITRAKSLLVVIGNPHILCKDVHWNNILWYCVDNSSYKGCFLPEREELTVKEDAWKGLEGQSGGEDRDKCEPFKTQCEQGKEQYNWESADGQWVNEGNSWEPSKDQWVNGENNWEPSHVQWGDTGTNRESSNGQSGEKHNGWESSNAERDERQNNPEWSCDVKAGVEEISTLISDMSYMDIQPTGWD